MIATTYGSGPFYPAIAWYHRLWVAKVSFETEDEAFNVADGVVCYLNAQATDYINKLDYSPRATEAIPDGEQVII